VVLLLSGQFGQLLNLVVFVAWLFYVCTMIGVLILRRTRPQLNRPYKVWGYPVVPLVGIGAGLWILYSSLVSAPGMSLIGLGLTATGFPVYYWLRRQQKAAGQAQAPERAAAD
jgi:APA family basic amino acid/polyamine antiporter